MEPCPRDSITDAVRRLLGCSDVALDRLDGGFNNMVYKITADGRTCLGKHYFTHPGDPRDRLGTEFGMLGFLWSHEIRCVPQPLACDTDLHLGIYEFMTGTSLDLSGVTAEHVGQLEGFLVSMHALRLEPEAKKLPPASDSAFSIRGHLDAVDRRFLRVEKALSASSSSGAGQFMAQAVRPVYERLVKHVTMLSEQYGLKLEAEIRREDQTLSPADHGFHNTLEKPSGELVFLDFEYSGWDDPVQMMVNACHQPKIPMPVHGRLGFLKSMAEKLSLGENEVNRIGVLYPLLGMKWCLIMLNEFLPVAGERRRFSGDCPEDHRSDQLLLARHKLEEIQDLLEGPSVSEQLQAA